MFTIGFTKVANTAADRAKISAIGNVGKQIKKITKSMDIPMRPPEISHADWYEKHLPKLLKERAK